jgi:hypothetical protein
VRPPCEEYAYAVPLEQMAALARLFDPPAEIIAEYSTDLSAQIRADEAAILHMLTRRPCTLDQICQAFSLHKNEASKYLGKLVRTGQVTQQRKNGKGFYSGVHGKALDHATA